MSRTVRWAPKIPVAMIVRLYRSDAELRRDDELVDDVGWRLLARSQDVLLVTDSKVVCLTCGTTFQVPWIGEPVDRSSTCPGCGWSITSEEYHATFEHRDLNGAGARDAFADCVSRWSAVGRTLTRGDGVVVGDHVTQDETVLGRGRRARVAEVPTDSRGSQRVF